MHDADQRSPSPAIIVGEISNSVSTAHFGGVALVTFSNPPVNALTVGGGLIRKLAAALTQALSDPSVLAIVIASAGKTFSAGGDIKEFASNPLLSDQVRQLQTELIEAADKPIVAAMQGRALGGGLELALSCHARIASPAAAFALPEIMLGLLPGGGGTQRLPRLIGMARAQDMILTGDTIDAVKALEIGLIDRIATEDLTAEAVALARSLAGTPPRRCSHLLVDAPPQPRARRGKFNEAADAIVACLEAANSRPFAEGLQHEKDLFDQLLASEASLGLRHVFFGRRVVGQLPGADPAITAKSVRNVAIVGGGTMGVGIANALLNSGLSVTLIDPKESARDKAAASIGKSIERDVEKGRISREVASARIANLRVSAAIAEIESADLIIEAVFEDMAVKRTVFSEITRHARADAILASNTSTLNIDELAEASDRPANFVGMHFFSPANVMKLLEIVRGAKTSPATLTTATKFAHDIGKVGVVSGVCDGFIGNRMFEEYLRQAYFLLEEGASPAQIDAALEAWGMAMGPLKVMDLAGQDIGWDIRKRRKIEQPNRPYSYIPDMICELGRFGQKTGAGYYLYPDGRTPQVDPNIEQLIANYAKSQGIEQRKISDEEIVERCVFALINEGAQLLDEKIAYRPVDVDMVYVFGYGFPAERGGPMFYGERIGYANVVRRMCEFEQGRNAWSWKPSPLLLKLAARD